MRIFLCLLALSSLAACTSSVNADEGDWVSLTSMESESLFVEKCGMCHRESGMGTGILERRMDSEIALLENRTDLNEDYVAVVVRNGLNTMFPLSRGEVSDDQLSAIAEYLSAGGE